MWYEGRGENDEESYEDTHMFQRALPRITWRDSQLQLPCRLVEGGGARSVGDEKQSNS